MPEKNLTNKVKSQLRALTETAKQIFEDSKLGDENCNNGILIIYIKDEQKVFIYYYLKKFIIKIITLKKFF